MKVNVFFCVSGSVPLFVSFFYECESVCIAANASISVHMIPVTRKISTNRIVVF
jgi:hypothetical protein